MLYIGNRDADDPLSDRPNLYTIVEELGSVSTVSLSPVSQLKSDGHTLSHPYVITQGKQNTNMAVLLDMRVLQAHRTHLYMNSLTLQDKVVYVSLTGT